jgi:hypothetical protein
MRRIVLASVLSIAFVPVSAPGATHAPNDRIRHSTSSNWSGYAALGGGYTSIASTWIQPAVTCTTQNTWSSFWVGLDGDGSSTVEQTGTEADCRNGVPAYSAWYEMYPKWPVTWSMAVHAGDSFTASVVVGKRGVFTLTLRNNTTGATASVAQNAKQARLYSAEVIAEAPWSNGVLPLSNFATVSFTNSRANGNAIGTYAPDGMTMVMPDGTPKATPGALTNGTDFQVVWSHV